MTLQVLILLKDRAHQASKRHEVFGDNNPYDRPRLEVRVKDKGSSFHSIA
jgi:hypothetical protein